MSRIAVIDDRTDNAEMLQVFLARDGHEAEVFNTGPQFLDSFRNAPFDLILLDIALPEMDGYETFNRIREIDEKVPVLALTAYVLPHDRENLLRHGFAEHIAKPIVDFDEFLNEVSRHIKKAYRLVKAG